ncbi:MAG: HAD-IA family hydrolase [Rhizobiaceae bacterium]|nr:HAD-IA family hydrolase [Rhizobiaceae bacterium]
MTLKALIFDVDGTLAETEESHRVSFNQAFAETGMDWNWSRDLYRKLLKTNGGIHRLRKFAELENVEQPDCLKLHARKTEIYQENVSAGKVPLRPGVERLIRQAREAGLPMAIATATGLSNVYSLLTKNLGEGSIEWFKVISTANDTTKRKPDPHVFQITLDRLELKAHQCLAFEDSRNGLLSSTSINIPTLVTPSVYTDDQDFSEAMCVVTTLGEPEYHAEHISGTRIGSGIIDVEALKSAFA